MYAMPLKDIEEFIEQDRKRENYFYLANNHPTGEFEDLHLDLANFVDSPAYDNSEDNHRKSEIIEQLERQLCNIVE